ncbi:MAG: peptidoglycan-associated lipoprotein Pal [Gammaproteobacteria bacterium]|nr:peptidoglycan-associated lipoprotein Pal [Gammaproteobacteria bacterium]
MKFLTKFSPALLLLPAILLLSACGTTGEAEQEQAQAVAGGGAAADSDDGANASGASSGSADAMPMMEPEPEPEPLRDPLEEGLLAQRVVYFEFDSSVIRDDALPLIQAHAQYLASNPMLITLEGHADERGTREYNIALGERRADSVRRLLMANGVPGNQIKVVSYGEERPAALGHNEDAWSLNRRSELMYLR